MEPEVVSLVHAMDSFFAQLGVSGPAALYAPLI
jgi:hypothetical protein